MGIRLHARGHRAALVAVALLLVACTSEDRRRVETDSVETRFVPYAGPRYALSIGQFQNSSPYMRGIFSEGPDRLGEQAKTILATHLAQSGRFTLVDRRNLDELATESAIAGTGQSLTGAQVVVTGEVTEFGRRTTSDQQLFGLGGRGKQQVAYAVVSLNVVDVATSQVVYAVQGGGEVELATREVLGTGSGAGYDSTLNGKVLNLAILDAVDKLVAGLEAGGWSPTPQRRQT